MNNYEVVENDIRFVFNHDTVERYRFKFSTNKKTELINRQIKVSYVYDFDAHIDGLENIIYLKEGNTIEIPYADVPNRQHLASIRIEYYLNSQEKRYGWITEYNVLNVKKGDVPNVVEVEFVKTPKRETVHRTIKAIIDDEVLKILSSTKTRASLPDFYPEMHLADKYYLRK